MKWTTKEPTKPGTYLVAWINAVRGNKQVSEMVLHEDGDWSWPQDAAGIYSMVTSNVAFAAFAPMPRFPRNAEVRGTK